MLDEVFSSDMFAGTYGAANADEHVEYVQVVGPKDRSRTGSAKTSVTSSKCKNLMFVERASWIMTEKFFLFNLDE